MPSERAKPSSRTSTTTSQGSRGARKPSDASKNEPVKESDKTKDRTSKSDGRGRPKVDKGKDKKPEPRGRSVSDRPKPEEKKPDVKTRERGKSESGNRKPEVKKSEDVKPRAGAGSRENAVKTREALVKEREKEKQQKENEKKEKEKEKKEKVSTSSTFYDQLFCTKVFCAELLYHQFQSRLKTIKGPRQNINEGPHKTNLLVCYSIPLGIE